MNSNPLFLSALELAVGIRERRWTSAEVVDTHLRQIDKHNPTLHAMATLDVARAHERAQEADAALARGEIWGPLHGVPVTVKDVFETKGLRTTCSFRPLSNYVPRRDATVVTRLREAGAILLGKTNVPFMAIDVQTDSPLFGRACNPWNIECTPGGSTGGGAAALASGMTPLEIGSDLAGSIRIPAHFCGVLGFKPTEHAVSTAGHIPELPGVPRSVRHMLCAGPLARTVGDLRLAFKIIAGPDQRHWEIPPAAFVDVPRRPLSECRFAWSDEFAGMPVTAETRDSLKKLADRLSTLGCQVERCNPPPISFETGCEVFAEIAGAEVGASLPPLPRLITKLQFRMMPGASAIKRGLIGGAKLNMRRYAKSLADRDAMTATLDKFLSHWDAWLCPVAAMPAFPHWTRGRRFMIDGQPVNYLMGTVGLACVLSMTGNPVVTLPIGMSSNGMPIGMQLVGRRWHDMPLLAVAEALMEALGPCRQPPGYS